MNIVSHPCDPTVVTLTLNAIKKMEDEDKALFSNEHNVKDIFQLGLQALKHRQLIQGESSYASDSSNKRLLAKMLTRARSQGESLRKWSWTVSPLLKTSPRKREKVKLISVR